MELEIVEAFKAFDQNGNGMIEMRELRNVLQAIDPLTWTDENVKLLIKSLDTNADGRLQFAEFVHWCFQGTTSADVQNVCRQAVLSSKEWRPIVAKVDFASRYSVDKPPSSADDPKLLEYIVQEECSGWYVQVERMISGRKALFTNGFSLTVCERQRKNLGALLNSLPEDQIVAAHLGRMEAEPLPNYLIVNFEHETPDYATTPPTSEADSALETYRLDEDGDGWFVRVVRFNTVASQAVLENGITVEVRPDQTQLLQKLLTDIPVGRIVVGLLLAT